jgi:hypothetical protein
MSHPVAGLAPLGLDEVVILAVRPSIGATRLGRLVGQAASLSNGWGIFTLGNLLAVLLMPAALALFFWLRLPGVCRRYMLTTRRAVIVRGLRNVCRQSIALEEFDQIDVVMLPGQQWLRCGEVIFRRGQAEILRFSGVPCPNVFRRNCLRVQQAILATARAKQQQQAFAGHAQ